jgi:hypothetical protein
VGGKTMGIIVLWEKWNKIKPFWVLHNIKGISEAVRSSEASVSIY